MKVKLFVCLALLMVSAALAKPAPNDPSEEPAAIQQGCEDINESFSTNGSNVSGNYYDKVTILSAKWSSDW